MQAGQLNVFRTSFGVAPVLPLGYSSCMLWGDLYLYYMNYTAHSGREVGTTILYSGGPGIFPRSLQTNTTPF